MVLTSREKWLMMTTQMSLKDFYDLKEHVKSRKQNLTNLKTFSSVLKSQIMILQPKAQSKI